MMTLNKCEDCGSTCQLFFQFSHCDNEIFTIFPDHIKAKNWRYKWVCENGCHYYCECGILNKANSYCGWHAPITCICGSSFIPEFKWIGITPLHSHIHHNLPNATHERLRTMYSTGEFDMLCDKLATNLRTKQINDRR
jgi:hypothetical protein